MAFCKCSNIQVAMKELTWSETNNKPDCLTLTRKIRQSCYFSKSRWLRYPPQRVLVNLKLIKPIVCGNLIVNLRCNNAVRVREENVTSITDYHFSLYFSWPWVERLHTWLLSEYESKARSLKQNYSLQIGVKLKIKGLSDAYIQFKQIDN